MEHVQKKGTRFSIRSKMLLGFSALFLILLITVIITLNELSDARSFSQNLRSQSLPTFNAIQNITIGLYDSEASVSALLLTSDNKYKADQEKIWQNLDKDRADLNQYAAAWNNPALTAKWQEIQALLTQLQGIQDNILKNTTQTQKNNALVLALVHEMDAVIAKIQNLLGDSFSQNNFGLIVQLKERLAHDLKSVGDGLSLIVFTQWFALLAGFMLSLFVTWLTARSIVNPIQSAINVAMRIANGERELVIKVEGNDEAADLLLALGDMHDNISDTERKLKYSEVKVQNILDDLQKRIKEYRNYIAAVSSGDLTKSLKINGEDDLSQLGQHLNTMTESLAKIAMQIVAATNEISTGLTQLETASTSQAASASQQATSVAEVSSVVEEIKTTSRQTLEKASALGESAEKTHQESEKGQTSVDNMADSMRSLQEKIQKISDTILSLSDKTQQIGEITNAVADIAKQSKMLALNAAIEAAKAGEAGKGFAVVAAEVKELAEKSQGSTDRVQKILQDIRSTAERAVMVTEEGTKSVTLSLDRANKLNEVMGVLGGVIQQSSMASQQIVAAVRQESAGIDQIVTSITEIDKVTSQFSSATEQTKSASVNLAQVALALKKTVRVYKLSHDDKVDGINAD